MFASKFQVSAFKPVLFLQRPAVLQVQLASDDNKNILWVLH